MEIYNLGAQSHVGELWLARIHGWFGKNGNARPERFGTTSVAPGLKCSSTRLVLRRCLVWYRRCHKGKTPFYSRSPYACAKVYAHWQTVNYRNPIICLRVREFYSTTSRHAGQNICDTQDYALALLPRAEKTLHGQSRCQAGLGYARDYFRAMWLMLQQDAGWLHHCTGKLTQYTGVSWSCLSRLNWQDYVEFDERYLQAAEVIC